jgi:hypothetical protein
MAKERWIKKNLLDALEKEFKAYDREYYVTQIKYNTLFVEKGY